jgi:hypothetical protein
LSPRVTGIFVSLCHFVFLGKDILQVDVTFSMSRSISQELILLNSHVFLEKIVIFAVNLNIVAMAFKIHLIIVFLLIFLTPSKPGADCRCGGVQMFGKVKVVTHGADFKVQVVEHSPDLNVQRVQRFPDRCGRWQFVDANPDFTVQFVEHFPDFKIKFVDHFPGLPNSPVQK